MSLTNAEIMRVANRYIGVAAGYLGDFSYQSLETFYPEYCDLEVDTHAFAGTMRVRFIKILENSAPRDQAKILRGVVERFPVGAPASPASRTAALRDQLLGIAERLERSAAVSSPAATSETVERALKDAEVLIRSQGPSRGVDRLHTALHGYLRGACQAAEIPCAHDESLTGLFKLLRERHPALHHVGPRDQDIAKVLRALATILDALNPVRNLASARTPTSSCSARPRRYW
jgi:hypothetical protein